MRPPPRPSSRRAVAAWALYDFANSSFTTLVVTFVYATYFTRAIATDEVTGTAQWATAVTVTALAVALLSPYAGALADRGGYRKRFLLATTALSVAGTTALFFPQEGEVLFALGTFVVANVAFEMANVFYNAYLPELAPPEKIGRISGYGWGLGYLGGLLCLVVALVVFVNPETPPLGLPFDLDKESGEHVRATNLLVAGWFALFAVPMFIWVGDREVPLFPKEESLFRAANRQFARTFREIRQQYRQVFRLLLARLVYNDGLVTIFAFGGIYAQGTFGFTTEDVIVFGIVINVSAGAGAVLFGFLDDRIGAKPTILITLVGLSVAVLVAVLAPSAVWLWGAALLIGLLVGPNQSASRSLLGRFVPPAKENEFYGFFAFSGKATSFLGPYLLGLFTGIFESQRVGVATVLVFFVLGAFLLLRVDEKEGVRLARVEEG